MLSYLIKDYTSFYFTILKCDDEPAEEIWFKYGLGQVLRGTFEGACDGTLDLVFRYLFPVFEASELNGFRSEMSSVDAGYVNLSIVPACVSGIIKANIIS